MEGGSSTDLHTSADPPIEGEAVLPESLRLHATIPTQTAAKFSKYHKIQPKNAVTRMGTKAFEISSGDNRFIDPSSAVLLIECSIRDQRGNVIPMLGPPPRRRNRPTFERPSESLSEHGHARVSGDHASSQSEN